MYYRNKTDITADQGVEIDAGSLWKLDEETFIMTLVDEDQHVTVKHTVEVFEYALKQFNLKIDHTPDIMKIGNIFKQQLVGWSAMWHESNRSIISFEFKTFLDFDEVKKLLQENQINSVTLKRT